MSLLHDAIAAIRHEAGCELARATDSLRVLQLCEAATGRAYATPADAARVADADARWTMLDGTATADQLRRAQHRMRRRR